MDPVVRDSLLWGLVGGLSFLVLVQGYGLLTDQVIAATVTVGAAVAVTVLSTAVVYLTRRQLPEGDDEDAGAEERDESS
jgi:hypothetical protein